MMKEALAYFPLKMMPIYGFGIFLIMFILILFWVNRRGSDGLYKHMSELPLDEGHEMRGDGGANE